MQDKFVQWVPNLIQNLQIQIQNLHRETQIQIQNLHRETQIQIQNLHRETQIQIQNLKMKNRMISIYNPALNLFFLTCLLLQTKGGMHLKM